MVLHTGRVRRRRRRVHKRRGRFLKKNHVYLFTRRKYAISRRAYRRYTRMHRQRYGALFSQNRPRFTNLRRVWRLLYDTRTSRFEQIIAEPGDAADFGKKKNENRTADEFRSGKHALHVATIVGFLDRSTPTSAETVST